MGAAAECQGSRAATPFLKDILRWRCVFMCFLDGQTHLLSSFILCLCVAKAKTLSAVWPEVEEVSAEVRAAQAKVLQLRPETSTFESAAEAGSRRAKSGGEAKP